MKQLKDLKNTGVIIPDVLLTEDKTSAIMFELCKELFDLARNSKKKRVTRAKNNKN